MVMNLPKMVKFTNINLFKNFQKPLKRKTMNLQKAIAEQKRHFIFNGKCFIKKIAVMKYIIGNTKGYKIADYRKANRFYKLNFNGND